ncbi:MAG: adenylate/guanylate cyclase domain-containing protein [Anaerolineales bacterium]|jgi:class 3 adenylate cyclase|nr:adenylate/guanylate cyclase domain-containing protein [Anaerolineales bacterium]
MWRINVSEPNTDSRIVELRDGNIRIGRHADNIVVLQDVSASRVHAEILLDSKQNQVTITDLSSTNGTYVNRQRIAGSHSLHSNDIIRIGQAVIHLIDESEIKFDDQGSSGKHRFTRELLLESLDEHAVLLYEVSKRLNTIVDIEAAMAEIRTMMTRTMSIDNCTIVQHNDFPAIEQILPGISCTNAIRSRSAEVTPSAMLVPVMSGEEEMLGLMYFAKSRPGTRPFSRRDLQLAIAISHQVALTIQRTELLDKIRRQENIEKLLTRFVPPDDARELIEDYERTGQLPGLRQAKVSILFSDMAGSTALAEQIGPQRFATILNRYYQDVTSIIFKHHGSVRYLGDGVMAIFEDRKQSTVLAEEHAVQAGIEILQKIGAIDFGDGLNIIIGTAIHTGPAMVGYIGSNERMEFNALGDTVNVAFRMQELARPNRLVIGPATMAAIVSKYQTRRIGAVSLKGREKPVQAYEVLDPLY